MRNCKTKAHYEYLCNTQHSFSVRLHGILGETAKLNLTTMEQTTHTFCWAQQNIPINITKTKQGNQGLHPAVRVDGGTRIVSLTALDTAAVPGHPFCATNASAPICSTPRKSRALQLAPWVILLCPWFEYLSNQTWLGSSSVFVSCHLGRSTPGASMYPHTLTSLTYRYGDWGRGERFRPLSDAIVVVSL